MSRRQKSQEALRDLLRRIVEKALKATEGVISFETALHELPSVYFAADTGLIDEDDAEGASHLREALFDALQADDLITDEVWPAVKEAGMGRIIRLRDLNEILAEVRKYHAELTARRPAPITFAAAIQDWMDERELAEA